VTDASFFKFKKAIELRDDRPAPFDKIKRPRRAAARPLAYFRPDFSAQPRQIL